MARPFDIFEEHAILKHKAREVSTSNGTNVQIELDDIRAQMFWLSPVDHFQFLPLLDNQIGDVRQTRNDNELFTWTDFVAGWLLTSTMGLTVDTSVLKQGYLPTSTYDSYILEADVLPATDDTYTISITCPVDYDFFIDNILCANELSPSTFVINLNKGQHYDFRLEVAEPHPGQDVNIEWSNLTLTNETIGGDDVVHDVSPQWVPIRVALANLKEFRLVDVQPGDLLRFDGDFWVNIHGESLDELNDVVITTPTIGQVLRFDGVDWVNENSIAGSAREAILLKYDPTGTLNLTFLNTGGFVPVPGMSIVLNLDRLVRIDVSWFVNITSNQGVACEAAVDIDGTLYTKQSSGTLFYPQTMGSIPRAILGSKTTIDLLPGIHTIRVMVSTPDATTVLTVLGEYRGLEVSEVSRVTDFLSRPRSAAQGTTLTPQDISSATYLPMQDLSLIVLTEDTTLRVAWSANVVLDSAHIVTAAIFVDNVEVPLTRRKEGMSSLNDLLANPLYVTLTGLAEFDVPAGNHTVELRWYNELTHTASTVELARYLSVEDIGGRIGTFFIG